MAEIAEADEQGLGMVNHKRVFRILVENGGGLDEYVDLKFVREQANKRIDEIMKSINMDDLSGWRLLIKLLFNYGYVIGIGKRVTTYPSDNDFIRISNDRRDAFHDPLDARFADYTDLQICLSDYECSTRTERCACTWRGRGG
ncbi:hypothetical protein YDYSY3_34470 [Paenibacillus chitinolyticus]|uniref:Imm9 family immunity protein n=1 Tax=Paenibacillus chitinolyticus TaxID=79263 RepID=UPI0026E4C905|nr:Imm9 family immunity protein [Paenibacillus chitinolyticus]GKS12447.1 hypothetical protein YDYSY3_34470 [Paenibacillus chitinolyticus]